MTAIPGILAAGPCICWEDWEGQARWCLDEIASVEGYKRDDYESADSATLARVVLSAWRDFARDKGLL